jgi:hypothetical protein
MCPEVIVITAGALYHYTTGVMIYQANTYYICHLWPIWERHLNQKDIGHVIYVLDWFFDANSIVMSIS